MASARLTAPTIAAEAVAEAELVPGVEPVEDELAGVTPPLLVLLLPVAPSAHVPPCAVIGAVVEHEPPEKDSDCALHEAVLDWPAAALLLLLMSGHDMAPAQPHMTAMADQSGVGPCCSMTDEPLIDSGSALTSA